MTTARPADPTVISSTANPAISLVRLLSRRDRRIAERAFVVEGARAVHDALAAGATPRLVLLRQDRGHDDSDLNLTFARDVPVRLVEQRLFDKLSDVQTPQGILAVFPFPDLAPDAADPTPLILLLDRVRDPGNLGALLRAAAGAGVNAVYLSPESVDPWNPKVVRAGMGAHFRIPILPLDPGVMRELGDRFSPRVVARANAPLAYDAIDWTAAAALVIGGETEGVSEAMTRWSDAAAAIPLAEGVESLNAAIAGSVFLFEAARQRRVAAATIGA